MPDSSRDLCFPTAINNIELDAAADWLAAVYLDCGIAKIGSSFTISAVKLDDVDLVTGNADETFAEITGEPARLQFQFSWNA